MNFLRLTAIVAAAFAAARAGAAERNAWPVRVAQTDRAGEIVSWEAAGPLIFKKPAADGDTVSGFRPLFAQWITPGGDVRETNVLYPIFVYRADSETYSWSVFQLINRSGNRDPRAAKGAPQNIEEAFDLWPFWFSRNTGSPGSSYHALFPIVGTVKNRFAHDELSWVIFPLYGHAEKNGAVTTATPWPFVQITHGAEQGFALWPLYGTREKPEKFHRQFFLWPLGWNNTIQPSAEAPAGTPPRHEAAFLPFFSRETDAGFVNASYLWPFFGYTDRTVAPRYHETRYFWPFLVQGRGDQKFVERWGPFYTHSIIKGMDKTWVMWPLYREKRLTEGGIAQTQRQLFYFVYWSLEQRSVRNPSAAPAEKSHLWPFFSKWDNGAGRRQFQSPSPLELFFPDNERVRTSWSPLFSIYRYDQRAPGDDRTEILWGLLTWRHEPERREFHFGPLLSVDSQPAAGRIALGNGLVGLERASADSGWRLFWFDFPGKANKLRASSR